jgi:23S rRNA (pseudouridine1915-N3)-methyltransferase
MLKIDIIVIGKIKEKYLREGILEYSKRLSSYCKLKIIEVKDESEPNNPSESDYEIIQKKEAQRVLDRINLQSKIVTLEIEGEKLSSVEFSKKINQYTIQGISYITFIIGGSTGLHESIIEKSNFALSLSNMTYTHQMTRIILLEQIYRAFKIIKGEPYHK